MTIDFFVRFMQQTADDPLLGPAHISLYAAILLQFRQQGEQNPISAYRRELVRISKISNRSYHKCMNDLVAGGYIDYLPSFNPFLGSLITLKIIL
ncbi:MAG: hypothetical protein J0I32_23490 [Sphingobacteriales bacterium]|nr:hypothetical protein [Sphingobacteriales bacterium]OJW02004.1 MAG: hypothetical protein BGO52_00545 [Sphingobacteriales bacterium 44-61]